MHSRRSRLESSSKVLSIIWLRFFWSSCSEFVLIQAPIFVPSLQAAAAASPLGLIIMGVGMMAHTSAEMTIELRADLLGSVGACQ